MSSPSAWSSDSLRADPHLAPDKAARVERMFAAIAKSYDLNNHLHSFYRDQAWRRRVVNLAAVTSNDRLLDVACGTGDLTLAFHNHTPHPASITGLDFTQAMLDVAAVKLHRTLAHQSKTTSSSQSTSAPPITFLRGDAMSLPFPDASFDILTIAFGLRNIADPLRALAEFRRVLAPAGRLLILEFSSPRNPIMRAFNALYCNRIMPLTASLIARDRSGAYRYLPRSVKTFMSPADLASHLSTLSFTNITTHPLTFGVCTITSAQLNPSL